MTHTRTTLFTHPIPSHPPTRFQVEANRNFANKLWNSGRYLLGNLQELEPDEFESLAVTASMDAAELATLPLPER